MSLSSRTIEREKKTMDNEELIALALAARAVAVANDDYAGHYILLRDLCWKQTGIDVAVLAGHMERLTNARGD